MDKVNPAQIATYLLHICEWILRLFLLLIINCRPKSSKSDFPNLKYLEREKNGKGLPLQKWCLELNALQVRSRQWYSIDHRPQTRTPMDGFTCYYSGGLVGSPAFRTSIQLLLQLSHTRTLIESEESVYVKSRREKNVTTLISMQPNDLFYDSFWLNSGWLAGLSAPLPHRSPSHTHYFSLLAQPSSDTTWDPPLHEQHDKLIIN